MAVDVSNNVYFPIATYNQIRVLTYKSVLVTIAGDVNGGTGSSGDNGKATSALLNNPSDIALDSLGNSLYIADNGNNKIRLVTLRTGIITTYAGT